jgi:hypothetical protein
VLCAVKKPSTSLRIFPTCFEFATKNPQQDVLERLLLDCYQDLQLSAKRVQQYLAENPQTTTVSSQINCILLVLISVIQEEIHGNV